MGSALDMGTAAAQYKADAVMARANGRVQRNQAYADAYKLEADAAAASHIAGDNMMVMRRNQALQQAMVRAAAGASGFAAGSGSKLGVERSVAEVFDMAVADAARSNAISGRNAQLQAGALRRWGDTGMDLANVQAGYLDRMSAISRSHVPWALVGGGLSTVGSLIGNYNIGR